MAKKIIDPAMISHYKRLVEEINDLEIKSNFGFPYTSVNGHMFSLLSKSNTVGIRLPKVEREKFIADFDTCLYQPEPGPLLKEYVTIPSEMIKDPISLSKYLLISFEYAKSLKPKKKKK